MARIEKAKYWVGVLYPENMKDNWEILIGDIVQVPYAYCKHYRDRDSKSEYRKDHIHLILAFSNTTTYRHAMNVFDLLSVENEKALNKIESCKNIRHVYNYLIHDTDTCRKQGKELYHPSERITGNNFDIGLYEQVSVAEKYEMFVTLSNAIKENGIFNYMDFYEYVISTYDDMNYIEVIRYYSSHFQRLCDGNYQKLQQGRLNSGAFLENLLELSSPSLENSTENSTEICCPNCSSYDIKKRGKTASLSQRWQCKDCGKSFVLD